MDTNLLSSRFRTIASRTLLALLLQAPILASAGEAVVNGGFDSGLAGWRVAPSLSAWNPLIDGGASLSPPSWTYTGAVLYQNLNVTVAGGSDVTLGMRLKKLGGFTGRTVAFDLDYRTAAGQLNRIRLLNPADESIDDWTAVSVTKALPADAVKVVRLIASRVGTGQFEMDDVHLDVVGTVQPVPLIATAGPLSGSLQPSTVLMIRGAGFGATNGQVFVGAWPGDAVGVAYGTLLAQVDSWSDTEIVARIGEPLRSGGVYVVAGGVEANGEMAFTVTSPNFTVEPVAREISVVKGTTAALLLRVGFLNGFTSQNGVSFFVVDPSGVATTADLPLKASGGFLFLIDTAGLAPGVHRGMAQSLEDKSYARFVPFTLRVVSVTNINVFEYDETFQKVAISGKTLTNQGEATISFEAVDSEGNLVGAGGFGPPGPSPIRVVSSDPTRLLVLDGNFGPRFFALESGSVTLTMTAPDGFVRTFPVTINLPAAPHVISANHSLLVADNSGKSTNTFSIHATEPIGWIGLEGLLNVSFDLVVRDSANNAAYWTFQVPEGAPPGDYLFNGEAGGATRFSVLRIVNAATHGQIAGSMDIVDDGGVGSPMDLFGLLECYDSNQSLVCSNWVESYGSSRYLAGYVPPGDYRLRFVPAGEGYAPLWFPNAPDFSGAAAITVSAGTTVSNVDFHFTRTNSPPLNLAVGTPSLNAGRIELRCDTVRGVTYYLEAKDSLSVTNWTVVQSLSGDGGNRTLADPSPPTAGRFYRIRMTGP